MKFKNRMLMCIAAILCVLVMNQCTENPLFNDASIATEKRWIRGEVYLNTGEPATGAVAFIEGYEVGTFVDGNGAFRLQISGGSLSGDSENGIFKVFFYINNYKLTTRQVMVRQGLILDGELDIENDGFLEERVVLRPLLKMKTTASLGMKVYHTGYIDTLLSFKSTCTIDSRPLYIMNKGTRINCCFLFPQDIDGMEDVVINNEAMTVSMMMINTSVWEAAYEMSLNGGRLKKGEYQYIPWFVIHQSDIPEAMKDFIGYDMCSVDRSYMNLPFLREGGRFYLDYKSFVIKNIE